ncbi:MAG: hypothetical protein EU547_07005 [Promethearchaeota archaeon]|nr:MAG: hypothetical protein EU547_07005 [Candidatus Lokiarchaeota archaeon]
MAIIVYTIFLPAWPVGSIGFYNQIRIFYNIDSTYSTRGFVGIELFFGFGAIEIGFFIISLILLYLSHNQLSIIFGYIGIIFHIFNYIYAFNKIFKFRPSFPYSNYELVGFKLEVGFFSALIPCVLIIGVIITLQVYKLREKGGNINLIKKSILNLGTKYPRLEINEIAEKTNEYPELIIQIVKEMINSGEIYAEYFHKTKSVAFNQQANINEIDNLMKIYKEWESNNLDKKMEIDH